MTANIEKIKAQLAELDRQAQNHRTSLEIQKTLLELKQKELERNQQAVKTRAVSISALDQALVDYQSQVAQVQEIENALHLIPTSRRTLEADLAYNIAKQEEARVNLTRTEIIVPFHCRITETSAEVGQYVQQGQTIARADGTERAEITAQMPMEAMRKLFAGVDGPPVMVSVETMDHIKMDTFKERFGLQVSVRLVNADNLAVWEADFARTDATLDAQTRTVGIIVAVDNPYGQIILGERPPLVRNMFCEVEIIGRPIPGRIVVPRSAVHDSVVYVVDSKNRLRRQKVTVDFNQSDFSVIGTGLKVGEQVVVTDVIPAINGMLLTTVEDQEIMERLAAQATTQMEIR